VTRVKPLVETAGVEPILTCFARFSRKCAVHNANDGIANSTFSLALEMRRHILLEPK